MQVMAGRLLCSLALASNIEVFGVLVWWSVPLQWSGLFGEASVWESIWSGHIMRFHSITPSF